MGALFYIIGALLKVYPPDPRAENPAPASKAMAGLLYIYVVFYSGGKYYIYATHASPPLF